MIAMFLVVTATVTVLGAELVRRIAAGDRGALRMVYERESPRAYAVALRLLKSREDAEDIVQDTFLEVWRRAESYDATRGEIGSWVVAMARSRSLDRLRRRKLRSRDHEAQPEEEPRAGPDGEAEHRERSTSVNAALARLPDEQRAALKLAYFDGLTQREIAERLATPLGTIKTRLRLGLDKLSADVEAMR